MTLARPRHHRGYMNDLATLWHPRQEQRRIAAVNACTPVPQPAPPAGLPGHPQHDLALAAPGLDPPVGHRRIRQLQHLVHHRPQRAISHGSGQDLQHLPATGAAARHAG